MQGNKDINKYEDIQHLVNSFYQKVRQDDLLANIFNDRIGDKWPQHLEKMYRFWQTVLLNEHTYFGSPFAPHSSMPIEQKHFERWVRLFISTVDESFIGDKATEAKTRARKMAMMFENKLEYYKNSESRPIK